MKSLSLQVLGTGSGVGKSVIVTALCRIFLQDGFRVCPFKAQNMALNSYVTREGAEIGRAQATQAQACRIEATADMNPILIKPTSNRKAQIIVRGKPFKNMSCLEYVKYKKTARETVLKSFRRLARQYELIVLEGAGSPAEVNLKTHDIVNLKMAEYANAPVILVGDIDKGGVFAWLVGTLALLTREEKRRVKGIIINKFRGDKRLLRPGINFLEKKTNIKVIGVIPYFKDIRIPEEDSVYLEQRDKKTEEPKPGDTRIKVSVIKLPRISNFTDFDALENTQGIKLSYVENRGELDGSDVIIIPGTKNTIEDLAWLKKKGIAREIVEAVKSSLPLPILIGICGGYQMLGRVISDPQNLESVRKEIQGLGLLPVKTTLRTEKILSRTEAIQIRTGLRLKGYQIHHGRTVGLENYNPIFKSMNRNRLDGARSNNGRIWGTYLHGVFDNHIFLKGILNDIYNRKGLKGLPKMKDSFNLENEFDKLAVLVRKNLNMSLLYKIIDRCA